MREFVEMIRPTGKAKYFSENPKKDSTRLSTNRPSGKSHWSVSTNSPLRARRVSLTGPQGAPKRAVGSIIYR
jgi:hypothetical protein